MIVYSLILAAGKGTRMKSSTSNKVVLDFNGKPLIQYGIDLFSYASSRVYIVVGAYKKSVIDTVQKYNPDNSKIRYINQKHQLGTGHAVRLAVREIEKEKRKPDRILVGYGDHMMYYQKDVLKKLINPTKNTNVAVSLVTTHYERPNELAWGHIIRDKNGRFTGFVEHKDANEEQKKITELNAGLYCFRYSFLQKTKDKLKKSTVTGEYYINDFVSLALSYGFRAEIVTLPFTEVGVGINTYNEYQKSAKLHSSLF